MNITDFICEVIFWMIVTTLTSVLVASVLTGVK
jgi:hypothetical protein